MPTEQGEPGAPGAWAVVNDDTPRVFLADDAQVISRVLALKVVAATDPAVFGADAETVRGHLLHERWAEAVEAWMHATGTTIDVYAEYVPVWTEADLDRELALIAIRTSKLFDEPTSV